MIGVPEVSRSVAKVTRELCMQRVSRHAAGAIPSGTRPVIRTAVTAQRDNDERPHTRHGGKPPASPSDASPREYPSRRPALENPEHCTVKRVTTVGTFRIKTKLRFIANARRGYRIGLDEEADGVWSISPGLFGSEKRLFAKPTLLHAKPRIARVSDSASHRWQKIRGRVRRDENRVH